jgi:hypothetical protein
MTISRGEKADRVMILDDRDNKRKGNSRGPDYQCADEIVKEILEQVKPAARLQKAGGDFPASDKKKILSHNTAKNGAHSTQFTVRRRRPPLSLFM